jgi:exodeoxyribonuclease VII large subunit
MDDRLFDPTPTLTVSELVTRARVVVERAFGEEIWVEGEIQNLSRTSTHVYFDLVECRDDGRVVAKVPIVLFEQNRRGVNALLKRSGALRMDDGVQVRLRGSVSVYDRTGQVQVRMTAIDPNHTVGLLAAERARVMAALSKDGLLDANRHRALTPLPFRVALLTSAGSAACEDFLHELRSSGLGFHVLLCDVRVQGRDAEATVVAALAAIGGDRADVVALVRGGGARTDLAAFDAEGIARAIAAHPLPVVTGLGHEIDRAVADEVAHASLKTPTACAAWLVDRVRDGLAALDDRWDDIRRRAERRLELADARVERAAHRGAVACRRGLDRAELRHRELAAAVRRRAPRALDQAEQRVARLQAHAAAYDPDRALARGWSITRTAGGDLVRSPDDAPEGTDLVTTVAGGAVRSRAT